MKKGPFVFLVVCLFLNGFKVRAQQELKMFTDTFKLYSISYPSQFELIKNSPAITTIVAPLDSKDDKFRERLIIEVSRAPENVPRDSLEKLIEKKLLGMFTNGKTTLTQSYKLGGADGRKLILNGTVPNQGDIIVKHYFAIQKSILFRVTSMEEFMYKMNLTLKPDVKLGDLTPCEKIIESLSIK